MMVVVLLHRADLPSTVITRPWHVRVNGSPKLPEVLQLLLLAEHRLASGGTLELKDEFGFLTPKLLLDLLGHPIEPRGEFLLVSAREPDTCALLYLCLYDNRPVGHLHCRYASNNVLLIFHVAGGSETQGKRYGVTHPVAILSEGMLWYVLLEHFYSWFIVYLVDDVSLGARHYALTTYWDTAVAYSPTGSRSA